MITGDPKIVEWLRELENRAHNLEQQQKITQARLDTLSNVVQRFTATAEHNAVQVEEILRLVRAIAQQRQEEDETLAKGL
jgi:hypothetical protein